MIISKLPPGAVYVMPQTALVSGSSFIYSQSLDAAYSTSPINTDIEYYPEEIGYRLKRIRSGERLEFEFMQQPVVIAHLRKDAVPLNLISAQNYFHFLIEWLPSLAFLVEKKAVDSNSIIVSGMLHNNMATALKFVLSKIKSPLLQLRLFQAVTCDRVVMAPASSHVAELISGGLSDSWYNQENIRLLRRIFEPLQAASSEALGRKLYIRRVSPVRTVTNSAEVEQLAIDAGYQVVQPERYGFVEQVRLFSSASHIIGPTGAWAANLLFVPESAKVSIFYPESAKRKKSIWGMLGECLGVKVDDVYGPISSLHPRQDVHSDYIVPVDICRELLRQ